MWVCRKTGFQAPLAGGLTAALGPGQPVGADVMILATTTAEGIANEGACSPHISVAPTFNQTDLNCNGWVNAQDTTLFRSVLGAPPGL